MPNTIANTAQAEQWEKAGPGWIRMQERIDAQAGIHGTRALDAADPSPGEAVLDIGCGPGTSTLQIAERLGPSGSVVGADISSTMVDGAHRRAMEAGAANVSFVVADAQVHQFEQPFDLAFSRFGVMFFADPLAAFKNVHLALKPTGRIAFACWQSPQKNSFMTTAAQALEKFVPEASPPDPNGPGGFSLAHGAATQTLLERAGFSSVELESFEAKVSLGETLEQAVAFAFGMAPALAGIDTSDAETASNVRQALTHAFAPFAGPNGVEMDSATWIVTARA